MGQLRRSGAAQQGTAGMALFTGTHINRVDRKGRVSVPASFRTSLGKEDTAGIALFASFTQKAIEGCGTNLLDALADRALANYSFYAGSVDNLATHIFEVTEQLAWDPEGRVMLPDDFLTHAGITDHAAFVGKGRFFQIWEPEALKAQRAADAARIAANPPQLMLAPQVGR